MNSRWIGVMWIATGMFLFGAMLIGCASIIRGGGPETVRIKSVPDGADCAVFDNVTGEKIASVKTPGTVTLNKSAGYFKYAKYDIVCEMANKESQKGNIEGYVSGWYLGGNLVFGGLIGYLIVDPATGAMWKLEPEQIHCDFDNPQKSILNNVVATDNSAGPKK